MAVRGEDGVVGVFSRLAGRQWRGGGGWGDAIAARSMTRSSRDGDRPIGIDSVVDWVESARY